MDRLRGMESYKTNYGKNGIIRLNRFQERKVIGDAEDENNMEEDKSLLDAIRYYESQETTEEDEFFTPDQTIGVYEKERNMSRFGANSNAGTDGNTMLDSK
ncbi:hypothetical protein Tco_1532340, partial [Tanacetum coccineum]